MQSLLEKNSIKNPQKWGQEISEQIRMRILTKKERYFLRKILEKSRLHRREIAGTFEEYKEYTEMAAKCNNRHPIVFHTHIGNGVSSFSPTDIISGLTSPLIKTSILITAGGISILMKKDGYDISPTECKEIDDFFRANSFSQPSKSFQKIWYAYLQKKFPIIIRHHTLKDTHIQIWS